MVHIVRRTYNSYGTVMSCEYSLNSSLKNSPRLIVTRNYDGEEISPISWCYGLKEDIDHILLEGAIQDSSLWLNSYGHSGLSLNKDYIYNAFLSIEWYKNVLYNDSHPHWAWKGVVMDYTGYPALRDRVLELYPTRESLKGGDIL